jgi:hypothetical protein
MILPVFIDSAKNDPDPGACPWFDSVGISTSPCLPATTGEAAANSPSLRCQTTLPVLTSISLAEASSSIRNIASW